MTTSNFLRFSFYSIQKLALKWQKLPATWTCITIQHCWMNCLVKHKLWSAKRNRPLVSYYSVPQDRTWGVHDVAWKGQIYRGCNLEGLLISLMTEKDKGTSEVEVHQNLSENKTDGPFIQVRKACQVQVIKNLEKIYLGKCSINQFMLINYFFTTGG